MPTSASASKVALVESQGGRCHFVEHASRICAAAERVAKKTGGQFLDQLTNAERATDCARKTTPPGKGVGTGGTSATIGRYIRYRRHATRLSAVDPKIRRSPPYTECRYDSVFTASSSIDGIGRQRVEPSFLPDRMVSVPDAASIAAAPRYTDTYFCGEWVAAQGLDPSERCGAWE
ncbi:cysteine synthase/cystathionine beta-synthase [Mycobacterium xenopi]|uniref:Cysteine synthase n=1 Tax=Mycobacterium xenopi TaxID=1789 RepID=A0AAD1LZP4_MYCXE|nr:hypothetical protein MYXE_03940 [Mycobacterium xenopi]SPX79488.1 cysteine synthase/cystathionine beta-synthase [Mycobacterium xenopi]